MMPQFILSESTVICAGTGGVAFPLARHAPGTRRRVPASRVADPTRRTRRYSFYCGLLMLLAICPLVTWRCICAGSRAHESRFQERRPMKPAATLSLRQPKTASPNRQLCATDRGAINHLAARLTASRRRILACAQRELIVAAWLAGVFLMAARLLLGAISSMHAREATETDTSGGGVHRRAIVAAVGVSRASSGACRRATFASHGGGDLQADGAVAGVVD